MPTRRRAAPIRPQITEDQLQAAVIELGERLGYKIFYIPNWMYMLAIKAQARGLIRQWSKPGFPDLVMLQGLSDLRTPVRLIFMELKSKRGAVRPAQLEWLVGLSRVQGIEVYVCRSEDWSSGRIEQILMNGPDPQHENTLKELRKWRAEDEAE